MSREVAIARLLLSYTGWASVTFEHCVETAKDTAIVAVECCSVNAISVIQHGLISGTLGSLIYFAITSHHRNTTTITDNGGLLLTINTTRSQYAVPAARERAEAVSAVTSVSAHARQQ